MSIQNFIPAVWAGKILGNLQKDFVYVDACNRDYEGEITAYGDQVKINSIGAITVKSYTKNTDIDAPQDLTGSQTVLLINQGDYFNFQVDDVDKAQTNPKVMDQAMVEASVALANNTDNYVAGLYVNFTNDLGNIEITTVEKAYDILVDMAQKLDEANVPQAGRSVIVTPAFRSLLRKDKRFTDLSASGQAVLQNGVIGNVSGMQVRYSNNVPVATVALVDYSYITAMYRGTISFADQIVSVEAFRPESRFGDAIKGLHVYGAKVVRPNTGVFAGISINLA